MFPFPFSFSSGAAPDVPVDRIANAEAMSFNGIDAFVGFNSLIPVIQNEAKGCVSMWIKFDEASPGSSQDLICFATTSVTRSYIHAYLNSTTPTLSFQYRYNGATQWRVNTTAALTSNTWYHVCLMQNSTEPEIYLNGVKVAQSFDVATDKSKWWNDFTLVTAEVGRLYYKNGSVITDTNYFNGDIDEVGVFNTALSASKIQEIYDATAVVDGVPQTANLFTGGLDTSLVYWNRMGDS